jgi:regulation of enolase protein 1 (concanavalin A-like superfamily)
MTFVSMTWLNPPPQATIDGNRVTLTTGDRTDFWRKTHYGFIRDTGHFLHHPVNGDFSAEVTIAARFDALYDQAGLMLRIDETRWVKAGIEMTDGQPFFSTVITNDRSDWSVAALPFNADRIRLRLTRHADAIRVQVQRPDGGWLMTRLGYLEGGAAQVGIMACSPERAGFAASFLDYTCGPAIDRALHD